MNKMAFILSLLSTSSKCKGGAAFAMRRRAHFPNTLRSPIKQSRSNIRNAHSSAWNRRRQSYPMNMVHMRKNPLLFTFLFSASWALFGGYSSSLASSSAEGEIGTEVHVLPFEESGLSYDHYNGVTLHLDKISKIYPTPVEGCKNNVPSFIDDLKEALTFWKSEGRRGIWIHVPLNMAHVVPVSDIREDSFYALEEILYFVLIQTTHYHPPCTGVCGSWIFFSFRQRRYFSFEPVATRGYIF